MRSEARLDSAVFQLTPTRTRCDLVIIANGKNEKLASGLLNPFLAHLKTAQDQVAKGGYSIILEPDPETNALWFTKGTMERFVRFVSTPEVLERVATIESEILQIENAIAIQGNDNLGLSILADDPLKQAEPTEGIKTSGDTDVEKAIVLYKPGTQSNPPDSNGSTTKEDPKVQLLRVLQTRKMVLQKEQGMAFARATAAGFDIDKMGDLVAFAESFGAFRLKEACLQFIELWKKKHETGQWLEIDAAEAMSMRAEFSALNSSSIMFAADSMIPKEYGDARPVPGGDIVTENDRKADKQIPSDGNLPLGHQEHLPGQFQHPYPHWAMHPPGHPAFQPYSGQGIAYCQNYPGSIPYFQPPYSPMEDPRFNSSRRKGSKRQSTGSKDIDSEKERSTRSQDDTDQNSSDLEEEGSNCHRSQKRDSQSGKKKSGVVVIQNLNYIASKKHGARETEDGSQSVSDSEDVEEIADLKSNMQEIKHKLSIKTSKNEVHRTKPADCLDGYSNNKDSGGTDANSGNWEAFQNLLLRAEEKSRRVDDMFSGEKKAASKKKQSKGEVDPLVPHDQDYDSHDQKIGGFDLGKGSQMRQVASGDPSLVSNNGRVSTYNQFKEVPSGGRAFRRMSNDEFIIYGQDKQFSSKRTSDPLVDHANNYDGIAAKTSSNNRTDESFMLPYRSGSQNTGWDRRNAISMDSETRSSLQKSQGSYGKAKNQLSYEPDALSLVPKRGTESASMCYDPAVEYHFENPVGKSVKLKASKLGVSSKNTKEESRKSDKERNLKTSKDSMEKRRAVLSTKGSTSKFNQLTEAQKRAEKLRSYKTDLQKVKKEREEEERKRLEALRSERQKRIATRSSSTTKLPSTAQQGLEALKRERQKRVAASSSTTKLSSTRTQSLEALKRERQKRVAASTHTTKLPSTPQQTLEALKRERQKRIAASSSTTKTPLTPLQSLEALKRERQKRIAASSSATKTPLTPQQTLEASKRERQKRMAASSSTKKTPWTPQQTLEALKRERQKRIAASSSSTTKLPLTPQQSKARLTKSSPSPSTKASPSPYKSSKFSDSKTTM